MWQYFSDSDSDSEAWNGTSPLRFTCGLPDCDCLRVSHYSPPSSHPVSGIVFLFFWPPHTHTSAWPTSHCLDLQWTGQHPTALHDFQQLCEMWFTVNQTADALQHNYIMLWLGNEGLRLLNSWSLTADQLQDPKNIWDRLALLEPSQNFRIHRLEMQCLCQKQGEDFYICKDASAEMQIRIGRCHTRENPGTIHSRNSHPKSPAGAPIKGWYPHSSTSIKHCKSTWGEHQAHEADTRPNTNTSNINHWCSQLQQEPQAVWKLWRHSCPTQVPSIQYNMLPVPQEESLAPGMPLGQQPEENRQHMPKLQRRGMDGHPAALDIAARQFTPSPMTAMMILPADWNALNSRPSRRTAVTTVMNFTPVWTSSTSARHPWE